MDCRQKMCSWDRHMIEPLETYSTCHYHLAQRWSRSVTVWGLMEDPNADQTQEAGNGGNKRRALFKTKLNNYKKRKRELDQKLGKNGTESKVATKTAKQGTTKSKVQIKHRKDKVKRETSDTRGDVGDFKEDGNTTNFMDITQMNWQHKREDKDCNTDTNDKRRNKWGAAAGEADEQHTDRQGETNKQPEGKTRKNQIYTRLLD